MRKSVVFKNNHLYYLDQTKLPRFRIYRECRNIKEGYHAIKELKVRGAPLIGVFAAYCMCISARKFKGRKSDFMAYLKDTALYLSGSRPTAVNLSWAIERIMRVASKNSNESVDALKSIILKEAGRIHREDIRLCANMAKEGLKLIHTNDVILTHCNTGFLAASGEGTALAVIYAAAKKYRSIKVYVDETRPLLQGARLSSWELRESGIDTTLITDNTAAYLMQKKIIDKILVGADRIAKNGDTANKIGTYSLAVLAKFHKIPFYVVAPLTSFDINIGKGEYIPIEQRSPDEIRKVLGKVWIAPEKVKVYNPAFDVTPHKLITAIVTDKGIIRPPFKRNIKRILTAVR
ncbi:MAG: S-methyl-5-thioribose-1-phosphate isomerase [Candidatus Omnitrophica bacterium 4484_171]|nr:MAG: S-methyl-5-thioribose-1-phosphate isomerase [Candidatus Omnitrophica bacterium 4484_171]